MAVIQVAQVPAYVVGLPYNDPADVEADAQTAARSTINVNVPGIQGYRAFLTIEPIEQPDTALATPTNGALTQTAAGSLASTTYYVRTTYVNENGGESNLSTETNFAASANNVLNVASPAASAGAVYYRVYASNTSGGGSGAETLQATVPIGTAWVEPQSGLVAGAAMPFQIASLVNGPCTITVTQGAGTISISPTQ